MANSYYSNTKTDPDIMEAADLELIEAGFDGAQSDLLRGRDSLSDLANIDTAKSNLNLGGVADYDIQLSGPPSSSFVAAGDHQHSWMLRENNLSDFNDLARARRNLRFGPYFTYDISQFIFCTHNHWSKDLAAVNVGSHIEGSREIGVIPWDTPNNFQDQTDAMYVALYYLYNSIGPF